MNLINGQIKIIANYMKIEITPISSLYTQYHAVFVSISNSNNKYYQYKI